MVADQAHTVVGPRERTHAIEILRRGISIRHRRCDGAESDVFEPRGQFEDLIAALIRGRPGCAVPSGAFAAIATAASQNVGTEDSERAGADQRANRLAKK